VARQNVSQTDIYPATVNVRAPNAIDAWSMFLLDFASVTCLVTDRRPLRSMRALDQDA